MLGLQLHAGAASFWREYYRELRRHAGNGRLPYGVRTTLRRAADGAFARSVREEARTVRPRWSRHALRNAEKIQLATEEAKTAAEMASSVGIRVDRPIVALEPGRRADLLARALELLADEGYQIVRIGNPAAGRLPNRSVIDVSASGTAPTALIAYLLLASKFLVCSSADLQQQACLTHTPSLRIDARDPFTAFPIRPDGLFVLAAVVDLDTGRTLDARELLAEPYFRNTRNCGYRATSAGDILSAVREMTEGLRDGWHDSDAQARFRREVTEAGIALGPRVHHIVEWDAAGGFVGDGRLARVQAERAL
ncbi:MAG: hypothetical protein A3F70_00805 [Acidobacteria bacterium RIFCSPLOWO2_12_FULL_67_14]|nr:MAG: hypothetical protein A3H29_11635 [Acidobacteria bacterium RIFCSPLOWO2_02_FULL_67_21]OFW36149.1 MAG: hypothetical protein A3F70_00805 [Acidobacteria bacterium RIFCSPLOWO2_12_FULL_67_14]